MNKKKTDEKINRLHRNQYKMSAAMKLAAERAKKQQPELIAISGVLRYVRLDKD